MTTTIERLRAESETLRRHIEALQRERSEIEAEIAACENRPAAAEWYRALAAGASSKDSYRLYVRCQAEIALTAPSLDRHLASLREDEREEVRAAVEEMRAEAKP